MSRTTPVRGVNKVFSYVAYCDLCQWEVSVADDYDMSKPSQAAYRCAQRILKAHKCKEES